MTSIVVIGLALSLAHSCSSIPRRRARSLSPAAPREQLPALRRALQKILAREGVVLKILPSEGSSDNLKRLPMRKPSRHRLLLGGEARDAKFENLGLARQRGPAAAAGVPFGRAAAVALGVQGQAHHVGPPGSGTQTLALALLKANGIVAGDGTTIDQTDLEDPARELRDGRVDVVFLMSESTATTVTRSLMRTPACTFSISPRRTATSAASNTLSKLHLPRGTLDFGKDIPPHDVSLIGPTVSSSPANRCIPRSPTCCSKRRARCMFRRSLPQTRRVSGGARGRIPP